MEGLAAAAEYAERYHVTLALENHGLMAGRSDQVRQVIDAVGSSALRANIDTGNFLLVNQNPTDAARDLAPLAALVHLKDFRRARPDETEHIYKALDGAAFTGAVVGQGQVDLPAIVKLLDAAGYGGWLSLEYEGGDDPLAVGVPQSLPRGTASSGRVNDRLANRTLIDASALASISVLLEFSVIRRWPARFLVHEARYALLR